MLTRPAAFNDPFELTPHYERLQQWTLPVSPGTSAGMAERIKHEQARIDSQLMTPYNAAKIIEARTSSIVVLSLSENRESLLMWSHYAQNHSGFLIGFDSDQGILSGESQHRLMSRVTYASQRPSRPTFEELTNEELLLTKSSEREYEREWRIIDSVFSADGEPPPGAPLCWPFKFRPEAVTDVIIGCRIASSFAERLATLLDKAPYTHVRQLRAFRHRTDYRLRIGHIWEKDL